MIFKGKKSITFLLLISLILLVGCAGLKKDNNLDEGMIHVSRVVDGDTIVVEGDQKVRLIGVDTPETVKPGHPLEPYGKEASDFTKQMLEGKTVSMEMDVNDTDQYDRQLRYVYLEDGTFFNELLIKEGYATVFTSPPDIKHADLFLKAQQYARDNNKGLWGLEEVQKELDKLWVDNDGNGLLKGSKSKIYHLPGGEYYDKTTNVVKWFKTESEAIDAGFRKSAR